MISSYNPFRNPGVSPQPTGSSTHSTANPRGSPSSFRPPSGPPPPSQSFRPPLHAPPSSFQSFSPPPSPSPHAPARVDSLGPPPGSPPQSIMQLPPTASRHLTPPSEIDEELPEYSATPDANHGEESIDFGPLRPFQRVPPEGQHALAQQPQPRAAQPHNVSHPVVRLPTARQQNLAPPPYPHAPSVSLSQSTPSNTSRPFFDFTRDFYAAGGDLLGATLPSPLPSTSASTSPQPLYAPPPGPLPPLRRTASNTGPASSTSGIGAASAGLSRSASANPKQPTTSPIPGHPLLNNMRTLVYPSGYVCTKCHNTGYKNYDPKHPCRHCWVRYGCPFTATLVRAWNSNTPNDTQAHNRQRPLPNFSSTRGASSTPSPSISTTHNTHGTIQPPLARSTSGTARANPPARTAQGQAAPRTVTLWSIGHVPPSATVVKAGDPRIGGRQCWRCEGRGCYSLSLFDEVTCEVCEGIGRTGITV